VGISDELTKWATLLEKGHITQAEFDEQKRLMMPSSTTGSTAPSADGSESVNGTSLGAYKILGLVVVFFIGVIAFNTAKGNVEDEAQQVAEMEEDTANSAEILKNEVDRQHLQNAENAGVLGALREGAELDGVFKNSKLSSDIEDSVGGLIGSGTMSLVRAHQNQGLPGPSSRGSGLGGDGPVIIGALDKALVDAVVERHMNQIKNCYQQELTKNPKLDGKVKIKFVISKNGSVARTLVESSTMNNKAVESCISGRFLRMEFPEPKGGGIVIVKYPFEFGT
jgi:hypothetical protein